MYFDFVISLIIIHFVSDWILQPRWLAKAKSKQLKYCLFHGAVNWVFFLVVIAINSFYGLKFKIGLVFFLTFADSILHMAQDWFVWRLYGKFKRSIPYQEDYWFYTTIAVDQTIHLVLKFYFASLMVRWI